MAKKTIESPGVLESILRQWAWAEEMRLQFRAHLPPTPPQDEMFQEQPYWLYMCLWYALLHSVLEAFEKVEATPPSISSLLDENFLDESAIRLEYLQPIIDPVTNVNQAVIGRLRTMHRITKLLCRLLPWLKRTEIGVVRLVAISTPETLHFTSVCIEYSYSLVAIAISNVNLVCIGIDRHLGNAAKIDRAQAVSV